MLVLSKAYADAMAVDMATMTSRRDVLVFGGSDAIPSSLRVPADRTLRSSLGGTATSLNLRTASSWLDSLPSPSIVSNREHPAWHAWAKGARRPDTYDRSKTTDEQVREFIRQLLKREPAMTKSRALRLFRDSNLACEQRRFGSLFEAEAGS
jgi:hypothetical protein